MLRRVFAAVVVAAGIFCASLATGFLLASEALRHTAGAGLTAAPSVPRPAGQLGGPIAPAGQAPGDANTHAVTGTTSGQPPEPSVATTLATSPGVRSSASGDARSGGATGAAAGTPGGQSGPAGQTPSGAPAAGATNGALLPAPAAPSGTGAPSGAAQPIPSADGPDANLPPGATPIAPAAAPAPAVVLPGRYHVQVGSFDERQNADALAIRIRASGYAATVTAGPPFRVWVGGYLDAATAQRLAGGLKDLGLTPELVAQ